MARGLYAGGGHTSATREAALRPSYVMTLLPRVVHDVGVRVLVVEDHAELANDIAEGLRDRGIAADIAYDGASALQKGLVNRYDVIVLDRDLPKIHGDAVCVALGNSTSEARLLMLTAAASIGDRVEGLNLGADDYLPKPFAFEELVARVHALARRAPTAPPLLVRGEMVLDRARRRAIRSGRELSLTRKELGVLEVLLAADGAVVSAEELLERVWDENADPFTRTVTVTLGRLRRKLGEPDPIETVVGSGYRIQ
jgi:DNA-binding response OmpR family regulator